MSAVPVAWKDAYETIATIMLAGADNSEAQDGPEMMFYDWVDLYGESSLRAKATIASLTNFHDGSTPAKDTDAKG